MQRRGRKMTGNEECVCVCVWGGQQKAEEVNGGKTEMQQEKGGRSGSGESLDLKT